MTLSGRTITKFSVSQTLHSIVRDAGVLDGTSEAVPVGDGIVVGADSSLTEKEGVSLIYKFVTGAFDGVCWALEPIDCMLSSSNAKEAENMRQLMVLDQSLNYTCYSFFKGNRLQCAMAQAAPTWSRGEIKPRPRNALGAIALGVHGMSFDIST
jgi:hypothetical protein